MLRYFKPLVITSIIMIYLIIIAGAVVRMTGSGMGCPDWPKCFGYLVPPTQEAQIQWKPNHHYLQGMIIIKDESLRIAPSDFVSSTSYQPVNWKAYTEHDYAIFNPWHTWIEYINRLVTVVSGFPMLLMLFLSFGYWKKNKAIPLLSILTIIAMGIEAYLGKTVVDSNLLPLKITVHLLMAFAILGILICILFLLNTRDSNTSTSVPLGLKQLLITALALTMLQVIMGSQVRQFVDVQVKILGENANQLWLQHPTVLFYVHRSFSILILLINTWVFLWSKKLNYAIPIHYATLLVIGLEAATGILMYYFDFPFMSQPIHLVLAAMLFGLQFYLVLGVIYHNRSVSV